MFFNAWPKKKHKMEMAQIKNSIQNGFYVAGVPKPAKAQRWTVPYLFIASQIERARVRCIFQPLDILLSDTAMPMDFST